MSYFVQETKTQEQSEREADHKQESKHFNANWNIYFNEHLREAPQNEKQHHTQNEKRTTSSDDVGFLDESSKSDIFSRSVYLVLVSPPPPPATGCDTSREYKCLFVLFSCTLSVTHFICSSNCRAYNESKGSSLLPRSTCTLYRRPPPGRAIPPPTASDVASICFQKFNTNKERKKQNIVRGEVIYTKYSPMFTHHIWV